MEQDEYLILPGGRPLEEFCLIWYNNIMINIGVRWRSVKCFKINFLKTLVLITWLKGKEIHAAMVMGD